MSKVFEICNCGMLNETDHSKKYKHDFKPISKLIREINKEKKHFYEIDLEHFPYFEENGKCCYFQCGKTLEYHNSGITINHEYKGEKILKRKIYIYLPEYSICNCCNTPMNNHFYKHYICTNINYKNKKEIDKINIFYNDRIVENLT